MDTRLPAHPNLGSYRKQAKELKRALAAGDLAAAERLVRHHPRFRGHAPTELVGSELALGDAQLVIAREQGHATWTEFKAAVEQAAAIAPPSPIATLMAAIRSADAAAVRRVLAGDPSLARRKDMKGGLPLVEACDRGLLAIAELLLDAGADPREGDPLLAAAHAGPHKPGPALAIVELLLQRGAPHDIFTHAILGDVAALQRDLVGADLEARGPANATPLFLAAWNGHVDAARMLLDAGAQPNPVCRDGQSLWHVIFLHRWSKPHRAIAVMLLERGVSCPFEDACLLSHLPTVERRLAADPSLKDAPGADGRTPLEIALVNADSALASVLLRAGADDPTGQGRALVDNAPQRDHDFAYAVYRHCSFKAANFHDVALGDAIFSDVNLAGARFDNVNLGGARIDNAHIRGMTIYGIEIEPLLTAELERRRKTHAR